MTLHYRFPNAVPQLSGESSLRGRTYTASFSDELGDRYLAQGSAGEPLLEVLQFKPELGDSPDFERALRARVDALRDVHPNSLVAVHSVERREGLGLSLVSEHIVGRRVSELPSINLGPSFAVDLIRTVTPVLEALNHTGVGVAHGALSANRIIVAADGRLFVAEYVLGWALEALKFSRSRLNALGIVVPGGFEPARLDGRTDLAQLGFLALSVVLRRHLDPGDCPTKIRELLDEAGAGSGSSRLSPDLHRWIESALQTGPSPFASVQHAVDALDELPESADTQEPHPLPDPETHQEQETHQDRNDGPAGREGEGSAHTGGAFDELLDETDVRKPAVQAPAPLLPFRAEILAAPAAPRLAPPPQPSEAAAFNVADLRASLERRQPTVEIPKPGAGRLSRIPEWILAAVSLIAIGEFAALMFLANDRKPADATNSPSVVTQTADVPVPLPSPSDGQAAPDSATPGVTGSAPKAVAPKAAVIVRFGKLTVSSAIDLRVFADGALVGSTAGPIDLREGTHNIKVANEALEFQQTQTVNVRNSQMTSVRITIPNGRISLNATPWAEVTIDGAVVGETPMANFALPIGSHQIVFRHPQLGERRQTIIVKARTIARVTQLFQR